MSATTPSSPPALWLIAGLLLGMTMTIAAAGKAITAEISKGNTIYLCVESWQMGIENPSCDKLVKQDKAT